MTDNAARDHVERPTRVLPTGPKSVRFVEVTSAAMTALLDSDLDRAGGEVGAELTEYFLSDSARWLWRYRLNQLTAHPESAGWLSKVVIAEPEGTVVGFAGFHGPPDETGMVEIGYSVDPAHRRQGYARAILAALMRRAAADARVRTLRVTISPDNAASLATIAGFGFTEVGEQWDEEDGLETIFEIPASEIPAS
ncbi:GNAT family N-acetyltransferase [Streptomyces mirabilis]|uniref:GNAT family N-acetyltransferase n=1 Tax=Streptomyces TaxID=1883 RepID=UPI000BD787E3|nr:MULTISPECIES: GNAT family N-acetyltransferase [unclassified Streptomyces]PBC97557.1 acetyltransferase (GNAT) family protein [Streptomyces sp. Ag82_O1-15]SOE71708.1 Acetyltransferase (GNAT) domain-containing protein [Streptomyces sp. OV198]